MLVPHSTTRTRGLLTDSLQSYFPHLTNENITKWYINTFLIKFKSTLIWYLSILSFLWNFEALTLFCSTSYHELHLGKKLVLCYCCFEIGICSNNNNYSKRCRLSKGKCRPVLAKVCPRYETQKRSSNLPLELSSKSTSPEESPWLIRSKKFSHSSEKKKRLQVIKIYLFGLNQVEVYQWLFSEQGCVGSSWQKYKIHK